MFSFVQNMVIEITTSNTHGKHWLEELELDNCQSAIIFYEKGVLKTLMLKSARIIDSNSKLKLKDENLIKHITLT